MSNDYPTINQDKLYQIILNFLGISSADESIEKKLPKLKIQEIAADPILMNLIKTGRMKKAGDLNSLREMVLNTLAVCTEHNIKIHFIDCGANIGQTAKWAKLNFKNSIHKIDCFEPLNENIEILKLVHGNDPLVHINEQAIWIKNETRKFHNPREGDKLRFGGSLILKPELQHTLNNFLDESGIHSSNWDIECIDFCEWLTNNLSSNNFNILKLDIEGAEVDVIPHIINNTSTSNLIDVWLVEFHMGKIGERNNDLDQVLREFDNGERTWFEW